MFATTVRFVISCFLVIVLPACNQDFRPSPAISPEQFTNEWIDAWDSHDIETILTFYTVDAFYEDVPSVDNGWAAPMRGHQMIRDSLVETFDEMPDLGFEFVAASGAGDTVVAESIMTETHYREITGIFSIRAVSVMKLKGDRIAWVRDYYDAHLLLTQLGLVPSLGSEY